MMLMPRRRLVLATAGTVATAALPRKPNAAEPDALDRLVETVPPEPMPEIRFTAADGTPHTLSEFRGRGMVVNLWATWCMPCVAEMPALAALARAVGPDDIAVMPLSSDRGGASVVEHFFNAHQIGSLPVLLDPDGAAARALGTRGIPTTVIVDMQGRERARLEGAADWGTPEAQARVRALVKA